ncbi:MAG TPA: carbonic anhydrase [Acidimicrobiia bacterium]|nr:carbonic anhydrase [Acidimicrobiia bacterium]
MADSAIPKRHLAILTCMDARVDVVTAFGLDRGDAHLLRNAGAVATDDVLRSLVLSQRLLETRSVWIVAHTDCGLRKFTDDELAQELTLETGEAPPFAFGAFRDIEAHVRRQVDVVQSCPWLPHRSDVQGYIYDVTDQSIAPVQPSQ